MYSVNYRYSDEQANTTLYCSQINFKSTINVLTVLTDEKEWVVLDRGKLEELDIHKMELKDI